MDDYPFGITNPSSYIFESVEYYWIKLTQNVTNNLYSKCLGKEMGRRLLLDKLLSNL